MTRKVEIRKSTWEKLKAIAEEEDETIEEAVNRMLPEHIEENYENGDEDSSDGEDEELDFEDFEEPDE